MRVRIPSCDFQVLPEWVDYNGHMGDFAYAIVFSRAVTALMDGIGLSESYRAKSEATLYTLELRIGYLRECHEGDALSVRTRVLAADAKRMHLYQELVDEEGALLAWCEQVLLHVVREGGTPHASQFPPVACAFLKDLELSQRSEPRPTYLDRRTGL